MRVVSGWHREPTWRMPAISVGCARNVQHLSSGSPIQNQRNWFKQLFSSLQDENLNTRTWWCAMTVQISYSKNKGELDMKALVVISGYFLHCWSANGSKSKRLYRGHGYAHHAVKKLWSILWDEPPDDVGCAKSTLARRGEQSTHAHIIPSYSTTLTRYSKRGVVVSSLLEPMCYFTRVVVILLEYVQTNAFVVGLTDLNSWSSRAGMHSSLW